MSGRTGITPAEAFAAGQRDMRNRARGVVIAAAQQGGQTYADLAQAIGALPLAEPAASPSPASAPPTGWAQGQEPPLALAMIVGAVAGHFELDEAALAGYSRGRASIARDLTIQIARELTGFNYSWIARALGGRPYQTLRAARRRADRRLMASPELRDAKAAILTRLGVTLRHPASLQRHPASLSGT